MKVKELIELLNQCNPESVVKTYHKDQWETRSIFDVHVTKSIINEETHAVRIIVDESIIEEGEEEDNSI